MMRRVSTQQVGVVNSTVSEPPAEQGGDTAQSNNNNNEGIPEYCSSLCPEQQVLIFTRFDIFASVYLQQDLTGLMEQLKAT